VLYTPRKLLQLRSVDIGTIFKVDPQTTKSLAPLILPEEHKKQVCMGTPTDSRRLKLYGRYAYCDHGLSVVFAASPFNLAQLSKMQEWSFLVRPASVDALKVLSIADAGDVPSKRLIVHGASGCGKSTVLTQALLAGKDAGWTLVHLPNGETATCCYFGVDLLSCIGIYSVAFLSSDRIIATPPLF